MKVARPILPSALDEYDFADFERESSLESAHVTDQTAIKLDIAAADMNGVVIEKAQLGWSRLPRLNARDVEVRKSDLSSVGMTNASVNRVLFSDCRMSGCDLSQTQLRDVIFKGCKLDMANFRFADLRRVMFIDCQLSETDFLGSTLYDVTFESCQLDRTVFEKATCKKVDLRTSELIDIAGWASLKGATIDGAQLTMIAPYLAHALGLTVSNQ